MCVCKAVAVAVAVGVWIEVVGGEKRGEEGAPRLERARMRACAHRRFFWRFWGNKGTRDRVFGGCEGLWDDGRPEAESLSGPGNRKVTFSLSSFLRRLVTHFLLRFRMIGSGG